MRTIKGQVNNMSENEQYITYTDGTEFGLSKNDQLRKLEECSESGHEWSLKRTDIEDSEYFGIILECDNCYTKYENYFHIDILSKYIPDYVDMDIAKQIFD